MLIHRLRVWNDNTNQIIQIRLLCRLLLDVQIGDVVFVVWCSSCVWILNAAIKTKWWNYDGWIGSCNRINTWWIYMPCSFYVPIARSPSFHFSSPSLSLAISLSAPPDCSHLCWLCGAALPLHFPSITSAQCCSFIEAATAQPSISYTAHFQPTFSSLLAQTSCL